MMSANRYAGRKATKLGIGGYCGQPLIENLSRPTQVQKEGILYVHVQIR